MCLQLMHTGRNCQHYRSLRVCADGCRCKVGGVVVLRALVQMMMVSLSWTIYIPSPVSNCNSKFIKGVLCFLSIKRFVVNNPIKINATVIHMQYCTCMTVAFDSVFCRLFLSMAQCVGMCSDSRDPLRTMLELTCTIPNII